MNFATEHPWMLALLPFCLIPLFYHGQKTVAYSSLMLIPVDRISDALGVALRVIGAATIFFVVLGLSGLFRPAYVIERIGQGAQMVLLLDRSTSMDRPFAGRSFVHPLAGVKRDSKGRVARRLLSEFVASRTNDMFGMIVFSTYPIQVLPLTQKQEIIQAAIEAGNLGKGLAETNIGAGLERALEFFENRRYTGSRIVMLVSDGGATLEQAHRDRIEGLMKRHRAALYWIYIRSRNSPGIFAEVKHHAAKEIAPERELHQFFSSLGTPYRAYTAENPDALKRAIADVNRLQSLPIRYNDVIPRRDLAGVCYLSASVLMFLLIVARLLEVRVWR